MKKIILMGALALATPAIADEPVEQVLRATCRTMFREINQEYLELQHQANAPMVPLVEDQVGRLRELYNNTNGERAAIVAFRDRVRAIQASTTLSESARAELVGELTRRLDLRLRSRVQEAQTAFNNAHCIGIFNHASDDDRVGTSQWGHEVWVEFRGMYGDYNNQGQRVACEGSRTNHGYGWYRGFRPDLVQRLSNLNFLSNGELTVSACTNRYEAAPPSESGFRPFGRNFRACSTLNLATGQIIGETAGDALRHGNAFVPYPITYDSQEGQTSYNAQPSWVGQSMEEYTRQMLAQRMPACTDVMPGSRLAPAPVAVESESTSTSGRQSVQPSHTLVEDPGFIRARLVQ